MHAALRSFVVTAVVIAMPVGTSVAKERKPPSEWDVAQRLIEPVTLEFSDLALVNLPQVLRKQCRLDVELDLPALRKSGLNDHLTLSLNVQGISLRSALRFLLRPHELGWVIRGEVLVITTADKTQVTRFYPVADLMPWSHHGGHGGRDADSLIDLIQEGAAPRTWDRAGSRGTVQPFGSVLVVSQSEDVHLDVQLLLSALRLAGQPVEVELPRERAPESHDDLAGPDPFHDAGETPFGDTGTDPFGGAPVPRVLRKPRTAPIWIQPPSEARRDAELRALLAAPVGKLKMAATRLCDVIELLAERSTAPLVIDDGVLATDEFGSPKLAAIESDGQQSLATVLHRLLTPLNLIYEIRDELIVVTTSDRGEDALVSVVYPVADLVSDLALDHDGPDELMEVFTQVEQDSWQDAGGAGSIQFFEPTGAMLVNNTREIHDTIANTLTELRKARPRAAEAAADRRRRWDDQLVWQGFRWRDIDDPYWAPTSGFGGGMSSHIGFGMFRVEDVAEEESQPEPRRSAPLSRQERKCLKKLIVDALPFEREKTAGVLILVREHEVLVRHRRATIIALERNLSDAPLVQTLGAHWIPDDRYRGCGSVIPVVGEGR